MNRSGAIKLALAALCALVLATRVPLGFERTRIRVVTSPVVPAGATLTVPLRDLSSITGLEGGPAAVVVRLQAGAAQTSFEMALDGAPVTRATLPPGTARRIDATAAAPRGPDHAWTITADRDGWQLNYLEFANVHGFTRGAFAVDIVPAALQRFRTLPWWVAALAGVGLALLRPRHGWTIPHKLRIAHRVACGVVVALFVALLVVDRVSGFKLLLAPHTFLLAVALLYGGTTLQLLEYANFGLRRAGEMAFELQSRAGSAARRPGLATAMAAIAAIAMAVTTWTLGVHTAGGADEYGYVAQAELFTAGKLYVDQAIVADLPDWVVEQVAAPLGFTPQPESGVRGRIVPTYSPGLPLLMAAFRLLGGPEAVYLVVPLTAGLTLWLTFLLGRDLLGPVTGLFAAIWLGISPAFLNSALVPMSDVPVSAWWLLAFVAALRPSRAAAIGAGIATTVAVLTRPNLAPLAIVIALPYALRWLKDRRPSTAIDAVAFAATAAVGPAVIGVLFDYWYGSPFLSGYGPSDALFSWSFVPANLDRYPRWYLESQTAWALAFVAAPVLLPAAAASAGFAARTVAWLMLGLALLTWLAYLPYIVFDAWWYLRFLLPSYPMLIVLSAATLVLVLRRIPLAPTAGAALLAFLVWHGVSYSIDKGIFLLQRGELRFQKVGEYVGRELPARSLFVTMQHSGSIRYYGNRTTLRYDFLPHDRLDALVAHLQARGWSVYFVLDEWEENQEFRTRFSADNALGKLDWTPIALSDVGMRVRVYDPRDRGAAQPVVTRRIE